MTRKESRHHMLLRYNKERQRNVLAKAGAHEFVLILYELKPSFNVGKIFRSAEAFGAAAVHLVNVAEFDPAPAKGSFRKVPAVFHETFADCHADLVAQEYTFFMLNPEGATSLCATELPEKSAFVLGHEEFGFSFDPKDYPELKRLTIPQFGSVQSLNVSIAASVVMYEYVRQWQSEKISPQSHREHRDNPKSFIILFILYIPVETGSNFKNFFLRDKQDMQDG